MLGIVCSYLKGKYVPKTHSYSTWNANSNLFVPRVNCNAAQNCFCCEGVMLFNGTWLECLSAWIRQSQCTCCLVAMPQPLSRNAPTGWNRMVAMVFFWMECPAYVSSIFHPLEDQKHHNNVINFHCYSHYAFMMCVSLLYACIIVCRNVFMHMHIWIGMCVCICICVYFCGIHIVSKYLITECDSFLASSYIHWWLAHCLMITSLLNPWVWRHWAWSSRILVQKKSIIIILPGGASSRSGLRNWTCRLPWVPHCKKRSLWKSSSPPMIRSLCLQAI